MSEAKKIEVHEGTVEKDYKSKAGHANRKLHKQLAFDIVRLVVLVIIIGSAFLVFHFFRTHKPNPIPGDIKKSAGFALYYPTQIPTGYSFDKNAANNKNGVVFLSWENSNGERIQLTEQARPSKAPDLNSLTQPPKVEESIPGVAPPSLSPLFQKTYSPVGQAIIGSNTSGSPTAIVLTPRTLINVSGPSDMPNNSLSNIVQSLKQ